MKSKRIEGVEKVLGCGQFHSPTTPGPNTVKKKTIFYNLITVYPVSIILAADLSKQALFHFLNWVIKPSSKNEN